MKLALFALVLASSTALADDTSSDTTASGLGFELTSIYRVPAGASPTEGPVNAPVTIVAWSDFACEYCIEAQHTLASLRALYPGQLRFVHRTLPLDPDDLVGAEAAMAAAAQGKFVPMKERMYALRGHVDRAGVELIARELGLDLVRFRADLDTGAYRPQIAIDTADARALGLTGTPAFFINGRALNGALPIKMFADTIDEELARAQAAPAHDYAALVADGHPAADIPKPRGYRSFRFDPAAPYRVGLGLPNHQQGPDTAPVTIVLFSDFECPYCEKEAPRLQQVLAKYGDKVRLIYRHFPVQGHRDAQLAAEAGVAAAEQGKFWAFHDQVFAHFGQLSRADLDSFARAIGLDMVKFDAALDSRRNHDAVVAEQSAAAALGVSGTPTMFVNGFAIPGARDLAGLELVVDERLAQAQGAIDHGVPPQDVYPLVMTAAQGNDRADPSTIPAPSSVNLAMRPDDRTLGAVAACRRHDPARAKQLAQGLEGNHRLRVVAACAAFAIDL